jgi:hypothetical protein
VLGVVLKAKKNKDVNFYLKKIIFQFKRDVVEECFPPGINLQ